MRHAAAWVEACILSTYIELTHCWQLQPSGDLIGDFGEDVEWPGNEFVDWHRAEISKQRRPIAPHEIREAAMETNLENVNGKGIYAMALGDWGASTWAAGGRQKCLDMSQSWANHTRRWDPNVCLHSMHFLCNSLGEDWRRANQHRCVGDAAEWLREENAQVNVAKQMAAVAQNGRPPKFILSVGDNFYWDGVFSSHQGEWRDKFEQVYQCPPLCVPFISALGNHDYGGEQCDKMFGGHASTEAQIENDRDKGWQHPANHSGGRWVMPDRFYKKSFRFVEEGVSIDVFVIDSNLADAGKNCKASCPQKERCLRFFAELQPKWERWLQEEFKTSTANWRIVVGHHPFTDIPSDKPGPQDYGGQRFLELLARGGAALYTAGHVHALRLDRALGVAGAGSDVYHLVVGAGGGFQNAGGSLDPSYTNYNVSTVWSYTEHEPVSYGFGLLHVLPTQLEVTMVNDKGEHMFKHLVPNAHAYRGNWLSSAWSEWSECSCFIAARERTRSLGSCSTGFDPECDPGLLPPLKATNPCVCSLPLGSLGALVLALVVLCLLALRSCHKQREQPCPQQPASAEEAEQRGSHIELREAGSQVHTSR
eukprot:TRINITY_DN107584_c0_g1_i1.p1 TRINITY_DN107584_c0_g1~~TRINITY_DN107584_c0_g1_i1.p1  ORF type:complete len:593 (+),score=92.63 TRINITY_DN107584_c0_g1_i1:98-1876(+)